MLSRSCHRARGPAACPSLLPRHSPSLCSLGGGKRESSSWMRCVRILGSVFPLCQDFHSYGFQHLLQGTWEQKGSSRMENAVGKFQHSCLSQRIIRFCFFFLLLHAHVFSAPTITPLKLYASNPQQLCCFLWAFQLVLRQCRHAPYQM